PGRERPEHGRERLQLSPTLRAPGEPRLGDGPFRRRQGLQGGEDDHLGVIAIVRAGFLVHESFCAASACRSLPSAERMRVFTVPRGCCRRVATSWYVSSEKNAASMA